jgi:hypothetical protein
MATQIYDTAGHPVRTNNWQDWANLVLAVWLFISPWVLQFGSAAQNVAADGATMAGNSGVATASWNAWVLAVIVFFVALSAIGRMEFWQEGVNLVLAIWIFIAPHLSAASWDHWVVGVLIFLVSLSMLAMGQRFTATRNPPRTL